MMYTAARNLLHFFAETREIKFSAGANEPLDRPHIDNYVSLIITIPWDASAVQTCATAGPILGRDRRDDPLEV